MRRIAIAFMALAFLAVPAAAAKCDDYGTCRAKGNDNAAPQTALPVGQPADDGITVECAVNKPGIYPVTGQITFLQAVAASEGFAEYSSECELSGLR